jgi:hypothetical protein
MEMCEFSKKIGIFHNCTREMRFHLIAGDNKCFFFIFTARARKINAEKYYEIYGVGVRYNITKDFVAC